MKPLRTSRARRWLAQGFGCAYRRICTFVSRRKLASCAAFACLGVFVQMSFAPQKHILLLMAAACTGMILLAKRRIVLACTAVLLMVSVLFSLYTYVRNERPVFEVQKKAEITGVVSNKPKVQTDKHRITLMLDDLSLDGQKMPFKAYVYLYGSKETPFEYGQRLSFTASSCWIPDGVTNPGGFDFNQYLWRHGAAVCASVSVKDVAMESGKASLKRMLFRLSDALSDKLDEVFDENADVMKALLIGDRASLSDETYEDFVTAGIAHLVALSGLHVSCIALLFSAVFKCLLLPKRARDVLTVICLLLYAVMTGASPSILRAVMMYAYFAAASGSGRNTDLLTGLAFACMLQLIINPLALADAGMQLSYLSVLSLVMLAEGMKITKRFENRRGAAAKCVNGALDSAAASFAVQTGTLPAVSVLFHSMPVLSVPVNLIAIPLGLCTVCTGAAALFAGFVSLPLARLIAFPAEWIWTAVKFLTRTVSDLPFATVNARPWSALCVIAFFLLMLPASRYFAKRSRTRKGACFLVIAFSIAVMLWPVPSRDGLTFVFLDAGYADACVVYAGNDAYVVDTGKDNSIAADYLTSAGAKVKGVFITHPDSDHAGGAAEILKRYPRAKVYVGECWNRMDVSEITASALSGREIVYLSGGDSLTVSEDVRIEVLWPFDGYAPKSDNDGSLSLRISYAGKSAVMLGDLTDKEDGNITCDGDILKVSHHGSKYATTAEMLSHVTPDIAVISVSSNGYGHPAPEVIERLENVGADIYRTDECGAITVHIDENGKLGISTMLSGGRQAS